MTLNNVSLMRSFIRPRSSSQKTHSTTRQGRYELGGRRCAGLCRHQTQLPEEGKEEESPEHHDLGDMNFLTAKAIPWQALPSASRLSVSAYG